MRLNCKWLTDPDVVKVFNLLHASGHSIYAVGGCVRDSILGLDSFDFDLATDAVPDRVAELATEAGMQVLMHAARFGTVTLFSGLAQFEITTFRKDIKTDGRHAEVTYTRCLEQDARRRDFTINAMYLDRDGDLIDPVGGLTDLKGRRVRFIGNPGRRIAEDTLRVLRFFRFNVQLDIKLEDYDPRAMQHIESCDRGRLASLTDFRVTQEMRKLMAMVDPYPALYAMSQAGLLETLFPHADLEALRRLRLLEFTLERQPDPVMRLALLENPALPARLRLTRSDHRYLAIITRSIRHGTPIEHAAYRHGIQAALSSAFLRAALAGEELEPGLTRRAESAAERHCPVGSADLLPVVERRQISGTLRTLEDAWLDSGFSLSREELLAHIPAKDRLHA